MTVQSLPIPKFETLPWFKGVMAGGDLTITCKQCRFEDDMTYGKHETKPIAAECPECGLGRKDWCVFFHGSPERQCKKCKHAFVGDVPTLCLRCGRE